jgi:hypothetical protein
LYWFHPLVWVAFRRLSLEAERAADDAVVRSAEHTEYAEQLVLLAGRLSKARTQPALGMANRSDLSARISAILDDRQRRGRAGRRPTAIALIVASLVAIAIAPLRAAPQSRKQTAAQAPGSQSNTTGGRVASALDRELVRAAEDGDISGIDELLRAGANVNCMIGASSPLIGAAREGRLDAVRLLLERGPDPNLLAPLDESALIHAAAEGHLDIVSLLLDRGSSIDHPARWGDNALHRASANGHLEVVKLLVARGADVNARAQAVGKTVKIERVAIACTDRPQRLTCDSGTIWQIVPHTQLQPALGYIPMKDRAVKIDRTIKRADDTPKQGEWRTPLVVAARGGHKDIVAFLLASGARE